MTASDCQTNQKSNNLKEDFLNFKLFWAGGFELPNLFPKNSELGKNNFALKAQKLYIRCFKEA